jgi:hypothetical protein
MPRGFFFGEISFLQGIFYAILNTQPAMTVLVNQGNIMAQFNFSFSVSKATSS